MSRAVAVRHADWPRRALFWSALPLIAAQGLWLRRRALRFDPAPGAPHGVVGKGAQLRLLALGDSIIAGVGTGSLERALPGCFAAGLAAASGRQLHWQALGRSGAHAGDLHRELLPQLPAQAQFDLVLLSIGVNDVTGLRPRRRFLADLARTLQRLRAQAPACRVVIAAIPPLAAFPLLPQPLRALLGLRSQLLDQALQRWLATQADALHVAMPFLPEAQRFAADGFHPNEASCAEWGAYLAAACIARWPDFAADATASAASP